MAGLFTRKAHVFGGGGGGPSIPVAGGPDAGILAAAFVTLSGTTPTIQVQKNVASVTRLAQGVFRITYSSALADANYVALISGRAADFTDEVVVTGVPFRATGSNTYSTAAVDVVMFRPNVSSGAMDPANFTVLILDPSALVSSKYLAAAMFTASGSTYTLQKSKNVGSLTRLGAGVLRHTFSSALADTDYSMLCNAKYPNAGSSDRNITGNSGNSGYAPLHGTASGVANYGKYETGASIFDVDRGGMVATHADDPPPGTLAACRINLSGSAIATQLGFNCTAVRTSTGLFRLTFTTTLSNANYGVICATAPVAAASDEILLAGPSRNTTAGAAYSTTQLDIAVVDKTSVLPAPTDPSFVDVWVFDPSAM